MESCWIQVSKRTVTEVVTKALARSGPELYPNQIRLADAAQSDPKSTVLTQSDFNQGHVGGSGGGGSINPDQLNGLATKEELEKESDARKTGDKSLLGLVEDTRDDVDAISKDYTTAAQYAGLDARITTNSSNITSLQEGFDDAIKAGQENAENIEIEFQSCAKKADTYSKVETDATFAKKEDIPEGGDLSAYPTREEMNAGDASNLQLISTNKEEIDAIDGRLQTVENTPTPVTRILKGNNVTLDPDAGTGNVTINANVGTKKIIAGENITISPENGTGNVTINAVVPEAGEAPNLDNYATKSDLSTATAALPYTIETDKTLRSADFKHPEGFDIETRHAGGEIYLTDNLGYYSNVRFTGAGNIATRSDAQGIIVDGSGLMPRDLLSLPELN